MKASCDKCVFWVRVGDTVNGICHRMPPTEEWFPVAKEQDWCGEFDPLDEEDGWPEIEWPTQTSLTK